MKRLGPLLALLWLACAGHKPLVRPEEVPIGPATTYQVPLDVIATEAEFPAELQGQMLAQANASSRGPYPIYVTAWCPRCKEAKRYLVAKHVAFVEKDIEKDLGASDELKRKLAAVGELPAASVPIPVFDVRGNLLIGFSAAAYDHALADPPSAPLRRPPR